MKHTCTICGRTLICPDNPCEQPEKMAMNCGIETGKPYHQEEYRKANEE